MTPELSLVGFDPFGELGEVAANVIADGWTAAMLTVWDAGLWLLRVVLGFMDAFLTPDLSADGPGGVVYGYTFWIAGTLVVIMMMVQLGVAAFRRDGKSLARVLIGGAQFVVVWAVWIGYGVTIIAACGGLTRALMEALLGVDSWSGWDPFGSFSTGDITEAAVATVLGLLGLVIALAALGHLLVLLTRAAALIVLVATAPISAAGLVSEAGKSWFWKSLRWFHAAAFTPVVMVLVLGLGVQLSTGVAVGRTNNVEAAVGTALPAVVLIAISAVAPLALFKLLAFVDPGTPSGSAVRAGLKAHGGVQGLLSGQSAAGGGSSEASSTDAHGRSAGESGAQSTTGDRFTKTTQGGLAAAGGPALAAGLGLVQSIGSKGAAIGADLTNQMGVGHSAYQPDFSGLGSNQQHSVRQRDPDPDGDDSGDLGGRGGPGGRDQALPDGGLAPAGPNPTTLPPNGANMTPPRPPSPSSSSGPASSPPSGSGSEDAQPSTAAKAPAGGPKAGGSSGGAASGASGGEAAATAV